MSDEVVRQEASAELARRLDEVVTEIRQLRRDLAGGILISAIVEAARHGVTLDDTHLERLAEVEGVMRRVWPQTCFGDVDERWDDLPRP